MGAVQPKRELSKEELQLVTAAFVVGMFNSDCADAVKRTLDAMTKRVSFGEAIHIGNFGYFTRENVNPDVAPALERLYQFVANGFVELNASCMSRGNES